jgi:uncharacterized protein YdhG (YjbR/CyaY superfamily)
LTKSKKQLKTIDEYIARFPEEIHVLANIKFAIRQSAPKAEEEISYGILRSGSTVGGRLEKTHRVLADTFRH